MTDTALELSPVEQRALTALYDALDSGIEPQEAMARAAANDPQSARLIGEHALHRALVASNSALLTEDEERRAEERAMSVLASQRALWQSSRAASPAPTAFTSIFAAAKARGLAREVLAESLGIGTTILTKLERRLIDASTIPSRLIDHLASELGQSKEVIWSYLAGTPTLASQASYRSKQAPKTNGSVREDFSKSLATAARLGEVTPDDQVLWQGEIASGRIGMD